MERNEKLKSRRLAELEANPPICKHCGEAIFEGRKRKFHSACAPLATKKRQRERYLKHRRVSGHPGRTTNPIDRARAFRERQRHLEQPVVYFVTCGDWLKIGHTVMLKRRLKNIRTNNPFPFEVALTRKFKTIDEAAQFEQKIHDVLRASSVECRNEWYHCVDPLKAAEIPVKSRQRTLFSAVQKDCAHCGYPIERADGDRGNDYRSRKYHRECASRAADKRKRERQQQKRLPIEELREMSG